MHDQTELEKQWRISEVTLEDRHTESKKPYSSSGKPALLPEA